ncbi:MAG: putative YigZ family protein [Alteromonadaceae bacterium]|jgi:uncharacterized YigZ family protein
MSYATPSQFHQTELEIKKSRFIAWANQVTDRQQAMAFLQQAKDRYPDARHHCWAYQIGDPDSPRTAAMSDDGEPSGTAGKPIYNVLTHKAVGDVMVIIIRYFGGIKLGAGGLVRAYSGATEKVMSQLPTQTMIAEVEQTFSVDFAKEQLVRHWLSQHQGRVVNVNYLKRVQMTIAIAEQNNALLKPLLAGL